MIKRILTSKLPLITYNPTLIFDINYFSACANAGALPVFDTEFFSEPQVIDMIETLSGEDFLFGIRIPTSSHKIIDYIVQSPIPNLDLIVFTYADPKELNDFSFKNTLYSFFIEAVDIDLIPQLERISPNGLILKGNEAPGKVSQYTSFILMQWYLEKSQFPLFIHGGVGMYTGAGIFAAGASGVVLDNQLFLAKESPVADNFRALLEGVTQTDTALISGTSGAGYRFFAKLGTKIIKTLKKDESCLSGNADAEKSMSEKIQNGITSVDTSDSDPLQSLFYLGQDASFAKNFSRGSGTVKEIITDFLSSITSQIEAIDTYDPLKPHSPLAKKHGTTYPVVQGPMANISDNSDFAQAIYKHGGLPFFAMGNLPAGLSETIISQGKQKVERFGTGLIGIETFNKTLHTHFELVKKYNVPFALFAGGIPSQVNELEKAGTRTYLHTPNMMMLNNAIECGCRRFIFEGTEAGGHVGSLSSFVLWESAMTRLMSQAPEILQQQSIIFAGGISTVHASCFISGLSSILAQKGAMVGIQIGSAYLFTKEIVELKSIGKLYQDTISNSKKTIVTGNTVGLPSRTVPTPFAKKLVEKEHRHIKDGIPLGERKNIFEEDNLGSLLISAKGYLPDLKGKNTGKPIYFTEKEQYEKGNFLVGDSLAFLSPGISIADIHNMYFHEKEILTGNLNHLEVFSSPENQVNDEIAIVGAGCILPDANNPEELWDNIISGKYSIKHLPDTRWRKQLYFNEDKKAEDKSYTSIAGFVDNFSFNHKKFGYTESESKKISRTQKMLLEAAYQAVENAGYLNEKMNFNHKIAGKTAVIIASCLGNELSNDLQLKYYFPEIKHHLSQIDEFKSLPEDKKDILLQQLKQGMSGGDLTPDPADGTALHMEASRIARHLKTDGTAYVVDAACATSFTAIDCAIKELLSGRHDTVITGGINTNLSPEAFVGFGKMGALSAKGSWPFDNRADGFVLGEGTAVFILKRLKDAIRNNDKIHGIIKGVGSSSDGKGKAIAAPNPAGQALALNRCFEKMKNKVNISDIGYIEAHGTSTIMGDQAEIETLSQVYKTSSPIGISSIKSQIGHLLGGAGAAGLMKVLLALKHKTLPPNGRFESLSTNLNLNDTPLHIIEKPSTWQVPEGVSRKAAISSYGFGGINYHAVIEEYTDTCAFLPRKVFSEPEYDFNGNRVVVCGLGVVLPGSKDMEVFSKNMNRDNTVSGMPEDRFHASSYYHESDPVFRLPEINTRVVDDFKFNNVKFRIPPMAANAIDRAQLFALDAASQALDYSGLGKQLDPGNKTAVIIGTVSGRKYAENTLRVRTGLMEELISTIPKIENSITKRIGKKLKELIRQRYPKNTEDTVPGFLSNIVSGRIANIFGCNGANFIVDASCASSAIALDLATQGLKSQDFDFVVTGGSDANLYPSAMFIYKDSGYWSDNSRANAKGEKAAMSEGAAVYVMTTLETASKYKMPILGELSEAAFLSNHEKNNVESPHVSHGAQFRAASTAVDIARQLTREPAPNTRFQKTATSALGGLQGHITAGLLPHFLSGQQPAPPEAKGSTKKRIVALLSGQGCQHPGMMKELYDHNTDIKYIMDKGEEIFTSSRGYSLLEIMFGNDEKLNLTENTQPAVFLSTAAIYSFISSRGFSPDFFIGHSVGEFSALFCSGMLGFDETMKLIIKRSDLMKEAAGAFPGKIMVVFNNAENTAALIRGSKTKVYIANKNSNKQTAVSGGKKEIEEFCSFLSDKGIMHTRLSLSGAFHSPLFKTTADQLGTCMKNLDFNLTHATKIISNVSGKPYPHDAENIKTLLIRQITSPVEFMNSIENTFSKDRTHYIEIGPNRLLTNLLNHINIKGFHAESAINIKKGQTASFETFLNYLNNNQLTQTLKHKQQDAIEAFDTFDFHTGSIVVSGVSIGLPGTGKKVFERDNFAQLLNGTSFIEPLPVSFKDKMVDKNVTKLHKDPDGSARFVEITNTEDVIQLAGQLGYFDLEEEYGIKKHYDTTIGLAMAAGIEALKDANIPLVMQYKTTSAHTQIPDGYALPKEMQESTGVILSALWPYSESLINEITSYYYNKFYIKPYDEFENIYYHLMESVTDSAIKEQVTDWFFKIKQRRKKYGNYKLGRDFAHNITPLGSAHFAQYIRAKGPNIQMNGACASTTQAIGIAEDWIRSGRCERVIIIGGETPTSESQSQWIGSGFLSLGAASVKKNVTEAAKPFDAKRNGTILGSGAVSMILEREEVVQKRGMRGQAEVLGTHIGNTAHHVYNIDVKGIAAEMNGFVSKVEKRHHLNKEDYSQKLVFMSHETYTPARGGSADAEITALRKTYPDTYRDIMISNTKGYTGHTLGAALEDAVLIKVMQEGIAPPIANLQEISDDFKDLKLSRTATRGNYEYGLHIAAGFGSHLAFAFFKRIEENSPEGNPKYQEWLQAVTDSSAPELKNINGTLCAEPKGHKIQTKTLDDVIPPPRSQGMEEPQTAPPTPKSTNIASRPSTGDVLPATPKQNTTSPATKKVTPPPIKTTKPVKEAVSIPEHQHKAGNSLVDKIKDVIAGQTGYDVDMLEDNLDLEADLGIDTVKQVEIFGKISSTYNLKVPDNLKLKDLNTISKLVEYMSEKIDIPAPVPIVNAVALQLGNELALEIKQIISGQTGYDTEMLEDNLDLEADLGIDTVKQVEIFGKISSNYNLKVPDNLKLKDLNTISKLVEYMSEKIDIPAPTPPAPIVNAAAPQLGNELALEIKQIISGQTGYDTEMLEDNLDLEADLGIDTVKQVEIFGKISSNYNLKVPDNLKLKDLNTIGKLAEYMGNQIASPLSMPTEPPVHVEPPVVQQPVQSQTGIRRFTMIARENPLPATVVNRFKNKTILITEDNHGFSDEVVKRIKTHGGRAITIGKNKKSMIRVDLANPKSIVTCIRQLKKEVTINGLIHLAPLNFFLHSSNPFDFLVKKHGKEDEIKSSVTSFFIIIKELYEMLDKPGTLISTISFNSVVFPYLKGWQGKIHPSFAGIAGMMKTANKELVNTCVRLVDFSIDKPEKNIVSIVDTYMKELCSEETAVECGYKNKKKYVPALRQKTPANNKEIIQKDDTVLVTGGALGITYEILKHTAKTYNAKLIIMGRSRIFDIDPSFLLPGVDEKIIMSRVKTQMQGAKPLEIKKAAQKILRSKQAVTNIRRLQDAGIDVHYESADVTNYASVENLVKKHKHISGVIHAAGIEESQFIAKKELDSFNRVTDVKVNGINNLLKALRNRNYRFFITFSSVTARFGNEGQIDYTGANDMTCKILMKEKLVHPRRHYKAFSWTAWSGAGMAENETVKKVLEARGITFLPLNEGIRFFMSELKDSSDTEVIITGPDYDADVDGLLERTQPISNTVTDELSANHPFIDRKISGDNTHAVYSRTLDLNRDLFLFDHSMEDTPIFLGATGIETMAESAAILAGADQKLIEISDFSIPYGIKILKNRPKELTIEASKHIINYNGNVFHCSISSVFTNPKGVVMGNPKLHYKSIITFSEKSPEAVVVELPEFSPVHYEGDADTLIYHPKRLFMDDIFKTLTDIVSFDGELLITSFCDQSGREFFKGITEPDFQSDVVAVDAMFQTGGLLEFFTTNSLVLPYKIERMRFYKRVEKGKDYYCLTRKTADEEETNTYQIDLVDHHGNLHIRAENFQMVKLSLLEEEYQIQDRIKVAEIA